MLEDGAHRLGLGEERDDAEFAPAGGTEQRGRFVAGRLRGLLGPRP